MTTDYSFLSSKTMKKLILKTQLPRTFWLQLHYRIHTTLTITIHNCAPWSYPWFFLSCSNNILIFNHFQNTIELMSLDLAVFLLHSKSYCLSSGSHNLLVKSFQYLLHESSFPPFEYTISATFHILSLYTSSFIYK